jgi:hypothetical protein
MSRIIPISIVLVGCFEPKFEADPALTGSPDGNELVGAEARGPDGGRQRKECGPVAGSLFVEVHQLPVGCTQLNGSLTGKLEDYSQTNVTSLVRVDGEVTLIDQALYLSGFESLEVVAVNLTLARMPLRTTSAMRSLRSVGALSITLAYELRDVDLPALEVIHGDLRLGDNDELRTLSGLSNLRMVGGRVVHKRNPMLSTAELEAFARRVKIVGGVGPW